MKKNRLINVYWQKINILNGVREKVTFKIITHWLGGADNKMDIKVDYDYA